jgi:membrane protease YdiL (CAAX protease family)
VNHANDASPIDSTALQPDRRHPSPDNPPWSAGIAFGVWVVSVLLVFFVPLIFVGPYALSSGIDLADRGRFQDFLMTDATAVLLQLAPIILAHALTLGVAYFVVTRFNTLSFRQTLGWKMNGFKIWHAVAITVFFYGVAIALTTQFGKVDNQFDAMLKSSRYAVYLVAFFATFTAPLVEEVIYRGLLYSAFRRSFGVVLAIVAVTILFTAVHVPQYSFGTTPDYATVITLLLLSLTLTLLRAWSGNLLPCIVLHTIFNGIQSGILLAEPYIRTLEPIVEPAVTVITT